MTPTNAAHNRGRCVTCCKPPNPNTTCGHWECDTDDCSALDVFWQTDFTTEGFERP